MIIAELRRRQPPLSLQSWSFSGHARSAPAAALCWERRVAPFSCHSATAGHIPAHAKNRLYRQHQLERKNREACEQTDHRAILAIAQRPLEAEAPPHRLRIRAAIAIVG